MPMQGDTDEESNFTQLLKQRGKDQPVLLKWLERKEDKYTSHEIQNEIISIMANNVIRNLVADIRGGFFALIANEYTDISNKEQLTIFIIHQTHYEKSDWSRAFNQLTIACELDMINVISASSTSAWLLSPLECSPQKQNG